MEFRKRGDSLETHLLADYCWIMVGSQRKKIIGTLNSEKLPNQIQKETGIRFCNVSRILKGMVERKLIECLDIEKKYRLYRLTDKGYEIKGKIQNYEL